MISTLAPGPRVGQMIAAIVITYVGAFLAVALRIMSRKLVGVKLRFDDYTAVAALVCATGMLIMKLNDLQYGLGRHLTDIPDYTETQVNFLILRNLWAADYFYVFACGLAKLSILALFWRLFKCSRPSKVVLRFLFGLVALWFTTRLILTTIQCIPAKAIWDFSVTPTYCVNAPLSFQLTSGFHFALDFLILLFPIIEIRKLQLPRRQRFQVALMFMSGMMTCATCLIQVINNKTYVFKDMDRGWTVAPIATWQSVETFLSVFTCSLPVLRPVWNVLRGRTPLSRGASTGGATTQASKPISGGLSTWRSFGARKSYADIESDSTYELTQNDQGKVEIRAGTVPKDGVSTVCVYDKGIDEERKWTRADGDAIRAHTNIEVKVLGE